MAISYSCDYCGEPIEDHYKVELKASGDSDEGGRIRYLFDTVGMYHASAERPCWSAMLDRLGLIHDVSCGLGIGASEIEERARAHESWRDQYGAEQAADKDRWAGHRQREAAWKRMGWEERREMFLRVLGDDRLIGAEIVEGMNTELGVPEGDYKVLHTSNIRQLASRLIKEGKLEEELEIVRNRSRYRYSRKVEVA